MRKPIESDYGHALQARASLVFPTVRMFRRNTGLIKLEDRVFKAGIPGQCDFYALDRIARHYEIELKNVGGKLSEAQETWREWCIAWGVPWVVLHVERGELPAVTVERWIAHLRLFFGL